MLAQALACKPSLLIADEPTTSLDTIAQSRLLELLGQLKVSLGLSLILVTHDPTVLDGLADRVIVLYAGTIVEEGPFTQLVSQPRHPYTRHLLASVPDLHKPLSTCADLPIASPGGASAIGNAAPGCPFEPNCPERVALPDRSSAGTSG